MRSPAGTPYTETMKKIVKRLVLKYPQATWDKPIVYRLAKEFDLSFSILKAEVMPRREAVMVLELCGHASELEKGLAYLRESGVVIEALSQDVVRNEGKCIHCGHCVAVCPSGAFSVAKDDTIAFDSSRCVGCGACVPACPPRAMEVTFDVPPGAGR